MTILVQRQYAHPVCTDFGIVEGKDSTHSAATGDDLREYEAYVTKAFTDSYRRGDKVLRARFLGFAAWKGDSKARRPRDAKVPCEVSA